jgi:hypothetical protein
MASTCMSLHKRVICALQGRSTWTPHNAKQECGYCRAMRAAMTGNRAETKLLTMKETNMGLLNLLRRNSLSKVETSFTMKQFIVLLRRNSLSNVETSYTVKQFIVWMNIQQGIINIDTLVKSKANIDSLVEYKINEERIEDEKRQLDAWRQQSLDPARFIQTVGLQTICCLEPELLETKFATVEMRISPGGDQCFVFDKKIWYFPASMHGHHIFQDKTVELKLYEQSRIPPMQQ